MILLAIAGLRLIIVIFVMILLAIAGLRVFIVLLILFGFRFGLGLWFSFFGSWSPIGVLTLIVQSPFLGGTATTLSVSGCACPIFGDHLFGGKFGYYSNLLNIIIVVFLIS